MLRIFEVHRILFALLYGGDFTAFGECLGPVGGRSGECPVERRLESRGYEISLSAGVRSRVYELLCRILLVEAYFERIVRECSGDALIEGDGRDDIVYRGLDLYGSGDTRRDGELLRTLVALLVERCDGRALLCGFTGIDVYAVALGGQVYRARHLRIDKLSYKARKVSPVDLYGGRIEQLVLIHGTCRNTCLRRSGSGLFGLFRYYDAEREGSRCCGIVGVFVAGDKH